jgi:hypothetical protein
VQGNIRRSAATVRVPKGMKSVDDLAEKVIAPAQVFGRLVKALEA